MTCDNGASQAEADELFDAAWLAKLAYEQAVDAVHGILGRPLLAAFARARGSSDARAPSEQVGGCPHSDALWELWSMVLHAWLNAQRKVTMCGWLTKSQS